jgi:serine/threonine protein kinase
MVVADQLLDDLKTALGDAYSIERELTGGGMSRVFVARERALGREVVIKVLPPELAAGMNHERFRREVQLAAGLSHPCIVPLLHAGESGDLLWFTMPFIRGESLKKRLDADGPMKVAEVVGLLRDVAEALTFAHSRGVIHRDIKPGNILSDGKRAQVTDFGVAKALGAALPVQGVAGHTTSGMAIGTPAYMAPEQLAADPEADHRVDIYAMGLLAYELLSGDSPFSAPSPTATMTAQLTRIPEPLETVRPDVPPAMSQLVAKCLAKEPNDRPADAQAVVGELDRISGAIAANVHRATADYPSTVAPPPAPQWPLLVSALAVIALIVVGLVWSQRPSALAPSLLAAADTVYLPFPTGDSAEAVALPSPDQPMNRADSLAIAAALRDELDQLEPAAVSPGEEVLVAISGEDLGIYSLERQLSMADSLIRTRLMKLSVRSENDELVRMSEMISGAVSAEAAEAAALTLFEGRGASVEPALRRVMVVASGNRSGSRAYQEMAESVVHELNARIERTRGWEMVDPSDEGTAVRSGTPTDVLVGVGISPTQGDSVVLRISLRDMSPGSSFGFHVVSSEPIAEADGRKAYQSTVRNAVAMMENLRHLESGNQWRFDMGRSGNVRFRVDTNGLPRPAFPSRPPSSRP